MNLSTHFTLEEMIFSSTAIRRGIDNTPPDSAIANLRLLCEHVLEPLRAKLGKPIRITSGYRSAALNKAVGGAVNSQHTTGNAVDAHVDGMTTEELYAFVKTSGIVADQIINEFSSWLHLSYKEFPRGMYLIATKQNGKTIYAVDEN